jgi:hypothetical protein
MLDIDAAPGTVSVRLDKTVYMALDPETVGLAQPAYSGPLWPRAVRIEYVKHDADPWEIRVVEIKGWIPLKAGGPSKRPMTGHWFKADEPGMPDVVRDLVREHFPAV